MTAEPGRPLRAGLRGGARSGRRPGPSGLPWVGARGRPAARRTRFGGVRPTGRPWSRRRKQSRGSSPIALARTAFGNTKSSKGSGRGPMLLAVLGGLGAAGAAAFKRRQNTRNQAQIAADGPAVGSETPTRPVESA